MDNSLRTDECIEEIVEKYAPMVYRLAYSQIKNPADADDIFQEVFLRYIRSGDSFESEEHRKAWLIRVTINCCKKLWSSAWHRRTTSLQEQEEQIFEMPEEHEICSAMKNLPQKYRAVLHLFYFEDLSISQISDILKLKPSTVRTQLTRARRMLESELKGDFDFV